MVRRRYFKDKMILHLYCSNQRRKVKSCPGQYRICLSINLASKAQLVQNHNSTCLKEDNENENDIKLTNKSSPEGKRDDTTCE